MDFLTDKSIVLALKELPCASGAQIGGLSAPECANWVHKLQFVHRC